MIKKAFVSSIDEVAPTPEGDFAITLTFYLVGSDVTQNYTLTFSSQWGSDWRLQCRTAIADWVLEHTGDEVDGVVFPDLATV